MSGQRERLQQNPLPIDRVAARVVRKAKPADVWLPKPKPVAHHVESGEVLLTARLPANAPRALLAVIGKRRDKLTVMGYAAQQGSQNQAAKWVVRCDCGRYEHRSKILRWLGTDAEDACRECRYRNFLRSSGAQPSLPKAARSPFQPSHSSLKEQTK